MRGGIRETPADEDIRKFRSSSVAARKTGSSRGSWLLLRCIEGLDGPCRLDNAWLASRWPHESVQPVGFSTPCQLRRAALWKPVQGRRSSPFPLRLLPGRASVVEVRDPLAIQGREIVVTGTNRLCDTGRPGVYQKPFLLVVNHAARAGEGALQPERDPSPDREAAARPGIFEQVVPRYYRPGTPACALTFLPCEHHNQRHAGKNWAD